MSKPRILIADDVETIRELFHVYLADIDVEIVGEAIDGEETLSLIESLKPDVVFLDIQMPKISGLEILDIIRDKESIFPVIVSGDGDFKTIKTALDKGAQGFITKPINAIKLNQVIDKYNLSIK